MAKHIMISFFQEDFLGRTPGDYIYIQKIVEDVRCNGFSCGLKIRSDIWWARFDDIKDTIGFPSSTAFNNSDFVNTIDDKLREEIPLTAEESDWLNKLLKIIKKHCIKHEKD